MIKPALMCGITSLMLAILSACSPSQDRQNPQSGLEAWQGAAPDERFPSQLQVENLKHGSQGLGATGSSIVPRALLPLGLDLIRHFESWSSNAYDDSAGYCTIGWGHLIALRSCKLLNLGDMKAGISIEDGDRLLETDSRGARRAVAKAVTVDLSEEEFSALSSFVFNVGADNFQNSTLLRLVNDGRNDLAAAEFGRWIRAKRQVQNGLIIRRKCEATLFVGKLRADKAGRFSRAMCSGLGVSASGGAPIDIETGEAVGR